MSLTLNPRRYPPVPSLPPAHYVVIGIDFGTTFSGVAWTWSKAGSPDEIEQVHRWDVDEGSARNQEADKVPSKISYTRDGSVSKWGYMVSPKDVYQAQWFKLLLSDEAREQGGEWLKETNRLLAELQKTPIDVVADYLRCLWKHAIEVIELRLTKIAVDNMTFRVVLTMPANWDHSARELTRKAAVQAGITENRTRGPTVFRMVPEPEAAALAAFRDAGMRWRPDFREDDTFVVCDAGGGTVDLTSYTVASLEPLELKMCVESEGDLCGAVYLDEYFESQIRTMVGKDYDKLDNETKAKVLEDDWEFAAKRKYNGSMREDAIFKVYIPGYKPKKPGYLGQIGIGKRGSNAVILHPGHMNSIFQPVVGKIVDLVRSQVSEVVDKKGCRPKAVLLVGGFGENNFVLEQLKKTFKDIPIQRPSKAWGVISRGAVFKGLSTSTETDTVTNYISKQSYGVKHNDYYDFNHHSLSDRYLCDFRGVYMVKNQFTWYLKRGQSVDKLNPVEYQWLRNVRTKWDLSDMHDTIWVSDLKVPPTSLKEDHGKTPDARILCKIHSSFDEGIFYQLDDRESSGPRPFHYRTLDYTLIMRVAAEELDWTVYWKDQEKGKGHHTVEYE